MWKLLVMAILPGLAVAQECPSLEVCEAVVRDSLFVTSNPVLNPGQGDVLALQEVCSKLPIMRSCIAAHLPLCLSPVAIEKTVILKNILEWVCTPEGKMIILNLERSACKQDPFFPAKFTSVITSCLFNIRRELVQEWEAITAGRILATEATCPFISKLELCVMVESRKMCGHEFSALMDNIWTISR